MACPAFSPPHDGHRCSIRQYSDCLPILLTHATRVVQARCGEHFSLQPFERVEVGAIPYPGILATSYAVCSNIAARVRVPQVQKNMTTRRGPHSSIGLEGTSGWNVLVLVERRAVLDLVEDPEESSLAGMVLSAESVMPAG